MKRRDFWGGGGGGGGHGCVCVLKGGSGGSKWTKRDSDRPGTLLSSLYQQSLDRVALSLCVLGWLGFLSSPRLKVSLGERCEEIKQRGSETPVCRVWPGTTAWNTGEEATFW